MKTVFTGREIFHVFAAQKQWEGKTGNRNVSFRDNVLFSYAQPIARIVKDKEISGQSVALITSRKFSITTSGHTSSAWRALTHFRVFYVPIVSELNGNRAESANLSYLWDMYKNTVKESMRARKLPWWIAETPEGLAPKPSYDPLPALARDVEEYATIFGFTYEALDPEGDVKAILAHHAARIARQNTPQAIAKREKDRAKRVAQNAEKNRQETARREAYLKAQEERNAKEDATRAERIEAWRKGGAALFPRDLSTLPHALLRVRGDVLETSHGASAPLCDAKRIFSFITRWLAIAPNVPGEKSYRAKLPIGRYSLDEVFANGDFRAGCHTIKYQEAARLAAEIGFTPIQETPEGWGAIEA